MLTILIVLRHMPVDNPFFFLYNTDRYNVQQFNRVSWEKQPKIGVVFVSMLGDVIMNVNVFYGNKVQTHTLAMVETHTR